MATVETDWAAVQSAVLSWVGTLASSVSGAEVYWRDDAIQHFAPGITAQVLLHISSIEERGVRTHRYESTGAPGAKFSVPKITRLLRIVLDVSVQAGWQVPGTLAQTILQRLQMRAALPELQSDLSDVPIAFSNAGPIASVNFEQDGYRLTQATSEWVMFLHDVYQDDDVAVETIENVYGVGTPPNDEIVDPATDDGGDLLP